MHRLLNSPVKLWEDPGQIATQIIFAFLTSVDPYYKHTKSRIVSENMKFDFFTIFVLNYCKTTFSKEDGSKTLFKMPFSV